MSRLRGNVRINFVADFHGDVLNHWSWKWWKGERIEKIAAVELIYNRNYFKSFQFILLFIKLVTRKLLKSNTIPHRFTFWMNLLCIPCIIDFAPRKARKIRLYANPLKILPIYIFFQYTNIIIYCVWLQCWAFIHKSNSYPPCPLQPARFLLLLRQTGTFYFYFSTY